MEPATEKQINFMKSLKIDYPNDVTKDEARAMIDRVVNKTEEEKPEFPVERPGEPDKKPQNDREFHLSIEECRARALECALEYLKIHPDVLQGKHDIKQLAGQLFNWIWKGE